MIHDRQMKRLCVSLANCQNGRDIKGAHKNIMEELQRRLPNEDVGILNRYACDSLDLIASSEESRNWVRNKRMEGLK